MVASAVSKISAETLFRAEFAGRPAVDSARSEFRVATYGPVTMDAT